MWAGSEMLGGVKMDKVELEPVVLIRGAEDVLAERALNALRAQARVADPQVEITELQAAAYETGALTYLSSPSLFGERRLVIVEGAESMNEAFLEDALRYMQQPAPDMWLLIRHRSGVRGKKLLDAVARTFPVIACEPIKREQDKADFVRADVRAAGRTIAADALQALLEAVGSSLRELDSAVRQLLADTSGPITRAMVDTYYGGRVEATSFKVADAAVTGQLPEALTLSRHALASGTAAVPIVAALALKLRALVKVGAARGRGLGSKELGMAPWQIQRAERELRGWTPEGLAMAIQAVAQADAEVKGASRSAPYAVERALVAIAGARRR